MAISEVWPKSTVPVRETQLRLNTTTLHAAGTDTTQITSPINHVGVTGTVAHTINLPSVVEYQGQTITINNQSSADVTVTATLDTPVDWTDDTVAASGTHKITYTSDGASWIIQDES